MGLALYSHPHPQEPSRSWLCFLLSPWIPLHSVNWWEEQNLGIGEYLLSIPGRRAHYFILNELDLSQEATCHWKRAWNVFQLSSSFQSWEQQSRHEDHKVLYNSKQNSHNLEHQTLRNLLSKEHHFPLWRGEGRQYSSSCWIIVSNNCTFGHLLQRYETYFHIGTSTWMFIAALSFIG